MDLPDFSGYELDNNICSAGRLIVLWFSKIDRELECWRQIQLTLVDAHLSMANVEIVGGFPPLGSCGLSDESTANRKMFMVSFDKGELSFECRDVAYLTFSRKIRVLRETGR